MEYVPERRKNGHTYENDGTFVFLYYRHMRAMTNSSQFNIHRYTLTMKNSSNVTHSCLLLLGSDPGSRVSNSSAMPLRYHRSVPTEALFVPALCHSSKKCSVIGCGLAHLSGQAVRANREKMYAKARLAQSAERKAFNLVVVGSSPTVGELCLPHGANKTQMQRPA